MRLLALICCVFLLVPGASAQVVSSINFNSSQSTDGLYVAPDGQLYATGGYLGNQVYTINPTGGLASYARGFTGPIHLTKSVDGSFYVTDFSPQSTTGTISRIAPDGTVSVFANVKAGPSDIVAGADGTLYVTHYGGLNTADGNSISKITPDGTVTDFAVGGLLSAPVGLAMDEEGNLYAANIFDGRIVKVTPDGTQSLFASLTPTSPFTIGHLAWAAGRLYATHLGANQIRVFEHDGTSRVLAGSGAQGRDDGPAEAATFFRPNGIAATATGDTLYVSEYIGPTNRIRMITTATNVSAADTPTAPLLTVTSYPNPAETTATIAYSLPEAVSVTLVAYDVTGREVARLAEGVQAAGAHRAEWSLGHLPAGAYLVRLQAGSARATRILLVQ
ncbi:MAG: T9SS type A sorting domain-containing protein [Bacteroidota bacterium]